MTARTAQVIVVGGGPAGAASAWALASQGAEVLVLDRARFPRDKPCAEYLSPQGSRILAMMGALDAVEQAGAAQLAGMRVISPDGGVIHGEFAAQHGFRGFRDRGLALPRRQLDPILLQAAMRAGAAVQHGVQVTDLARDGDGRVRGVALRDGRVLHADLVIGADGLRSMVARRMGVARRAPWPRRLAVVAHYRNVADIGAHGEMHVRRGGYVGLADVGHGLTNVALVVPTSRATTMHGDPARWLAEWLAADPLLAPRFAQATRVTPALATGPFAVRSTRAWADGALLVGDAADFFDPFTGEGIYAGLRGGELLAEPALAMLRATTASARRAAGRLYEQRRRHEFGGKWIVERAIGAAVAAPWLMNHAARVLGGRRDLADLLIGVTGDFVPPRAVLSPMFLAHFLDPRHWRRSGARPSLS